MTQSISALHPPADASWPEGTIQTRADVIIRGSSLTSAAHDRGTPLVNIGQAPTVEQHGSGRQQFITVLVTRVEHVDHLGILQRPDLWVDAALSECTVIADAARIIGRPTTGRRRRVRILSEIDPGAHTDVAVPSDIRPGDLLAIPCSGTVPRNLVQAHSRLHELSHAVTVDEDEDSGYWGACRK